ncbi:MAG: LysM peptidoglycan-binding domain-containing protein [Planctomycetales bacterium]|nr:LysM peptidoglycan-binding domain-containing protein [Planctomycetales bacterium]
MHRDKRIGLGLGILLVGVVGALFFRREPAGKTNAPPPPLESAKELNKQISEKATGPYIVGGPEEFLETAPTPPVRQPQAKADQTPDAYRRPKFLDENANAPAPDPLSRPTTTDRDRTPRDLGARDSASADPAHAQDDEPVNPQRDRQPILVGTIEVPAPIPVRATERAGSTATPDNSPVPATPATRLTHVTKSGETLSAIASKYLGSSTKFHEIYEANKNVLHSPDAVPEGVTLVIPKVASAKQSTNGSAAIRSGETAVAPTEQHGAARNAGATTSAATDSGPLKFEPVHRSPFAAGRAPKSNSSASPATSSSSSVVEEAPVLDATRKPGLVDLLSPENESINVPTSRNARPRTYKVQRGDTLEAIALKFYGQRVKSEELFKANRDKLASPNALREGMEIVVP